MGTSIVFYRLLIRGGPIDPNIDIDNIDTKVSIGIGSTLA